MASPSVGGGDESPIFEAGPDGGADVAPGDASSARAVDAAVVDASIGPFAIALTSVGIISITSNGDACARASARTVARGSSGLSLAPANRLAVGTSDASASRGAIDEACASTYELATSATVTITSATGGLFRGTYEAVFPTGVVRGAFAADACDVAPSTSIEAARCE